MLTFLALSDGPFVRPSTAQPVKANAILELNGYVNSARARLALDLCGRRTGGSDALLDGAPHCSRRTFPES